MKPQDLINGFKYFYPKSGVMVKVTGTSEPGKKFLCPLAQQDLGNGRGIPVSATKENCELLIPWQSNQPV
jgi:hypothetical protein